MKILPALLGMLAFFAFAMLQLIAGYVGIDYHLGKFWAIAALLLAIFFRITFPITIGAFFGAMNVWHWHWALAALFVAPGLIFIVPGILLITVTKLRRPFVKAPQDHKGVTIEGEYEDETNRDKLN